MNGWMNHLGKKLFSRFPLEGNNEDLRRVLVVHNGVDDCEAIRDTLEEEGYEVSHTREGRKAVAMVLNGGVDALLIKGKLSGLSGYEVASIVRRLDPRIKVILAVGDESELYGGEKEQVDFFPCLLEPIHPRQILRALDGSTQR